MKIEKSYTILFLIFSALLTTIWDYQFGQMDHAEHLPLLFRAENSDYLINDSFLNSYANNYDPRFYYTHIVLILKKIIPLPLLFLILTFLVNFLIAFSSFKTVEFLSENKLPGIIAALFAMSLPTVELGSISHIHADYLTPNWAAFAFVLWSTTDIFKKKWLIAALKFGTASLIHPLAGPESAFIFFSGGLYLTFRANGLKIGRYKDLFFGSLVMLLFIIISLIPYFLNRGQGIDDTTFIEIYANFRVPHHILPSFFITEIERNSAIIILSIIIISIFYYYKYFPQKREAFYFINYITIVLLLLAFIGYYFTEIHPLKLVVMAHIYRLLYLIKWVYILLLGVVCGDMFIRGKHLDKIYAFFLLICIFSPTHLLYIFITKNTGNWLRKLFKTETYLFLLELSVLLTISILFFVETFDGSALTADCYLWLALTISIFPLLFSIKGIFTKMILPGVTFFVFIFWISNQRYDNDQPLKKAVSRLYSLNDFSDELLLFSKKVKELTPDSAILVVPPMFAELRYLAERALVVSFKTLPFGGIEMIEWKRRLFDCYTWTDKKGFDAVLWAFEPNYKIIDEERLKSLRLKYGSEYAVLYKDTKTEFPILFENNLYKLVYIQPE